MFEKCLKEQMLFFLRKSICVLRKLCYMYFIMVKFPYVLDYAPFVRVDLPVAEELLSEYNDFFMYNKAQYEAVTQKDEKKEVNFAETEQLDEAMIKEREKQAELAAKAAVNHYEKLFGSKDFAESTLVGLKFSWYDLQQIFLEEQKAKTPIQQSVMNDIAPRLRKVASLLLIAERVLHDIGKFSTDTELIEPIREGFELLLERLATQELNVPEYHKLKKEQFRSMKKLNQYIEFCEKLFF